MGWITKRRQRVMNLVVLDGNRKSQCEFSFQYSGRKAIRSREGLEGASEPECTQQGSCLTLHKTLSSIPNTRERKGGQERKERNSKFSPLQRAVVVALDVYRFLRQLIPFAALAPSILLLGGAENLPLQ